LGVTCFSRARARCFESAEGKKKREWERVSEERLLVAIPVTMWDRRDDASNESTSFSLFCFFSFSFLSLGESERLSVDLNACFFSFFLSFLSLSTSFSHLRLHQITTTAEI
jgi:succinate-acetate transporter protein